MQPLLQTTKSSSDKASGVEKCAHEVLDAIPPVMWFIRRQMRSHRGGLSLAQFRSLVRVNQPPQATLSAVAEHLGASLPTTSRIVAGLAEKGFIERNDCRWDRRQVMLELTARGREVLATARKAAQGVMEVELKGLQPPQRQAVISAMSILKGVFGPASGQSPTGGSRGGSGKKRRKRDGSVASVA